MIHIVFENNRFVIVDKPHGWLSVPGRLGAGDSRPCLSREIAAVFQGALPVHRLDLEVSGMMLFGKDPEAHRAANLWFEERRVHKIYEAWTEGEKPPFSEGKSSERMQAWESRLLRGKKRAYESLHGKPSLTRAIWLGEAAYSEKDGQNAKIQRWSLEPMTGRAHQLRYELSKRQWPILGDALYGARRAFCDSSIALRAVKLVFSECKDASEYGLPDTIEIKGLSDV